MVHAYRNFKFLIKLLSNIMSSYIKENHCCQTQPFARIYCNKWINILCIRQNTQFNKAEHAVQSYAAGVTVCIADMLSNASANAKQYWG